MSLQVCPHCDVAMEVKVREDVMIDVCPSCRGIWLDRGELEKIIVDIRREERSQQPDCVEYQPVTSDQPQDSRAPRDKKSKNSKEKGSKDKSYKDKKSKKKSKGGWFFDLIEDVLD